MFLIAILIAIAGLQVWGAANPLHKDKWFQLWCNFVHSMAGIKSMPRLMLVITLSLPTVVVGCIAFYLRDIWILWVLMASMVMLYSIGRGRFMEVFLNYLEATRICNWNRALRYGQSLGVSVSELQPNAWAALNERVLRQVVYRAFERLFSVLFWFVLFGPAGALLYRLSHLYADSEFALLRSSEAALSDDSKDNLDKKGSLDRDSLDKEHLGKEESDIATCSPACYWLWVLEWPAARLFAISFALTGNFVGCLERIKTLFTCASSPTAIFLNESVLGALSLDSHDSIVDVGVRELDAMQKLLNRTLWLWMMALALISLF